MEIKEIYKIYFLFIALPIVTIVVLMELSLTPGTFLNIMLRQSVVAGSGELYFLERGGQRS